MQSSSAKQLLSAPEHAAFAAKYASRGLDFKKAQSYAARLFMRFASRGSSHAVRTVNREQFAQMLGILSPQGSPFSNFLFEAVASNPQSNHVTYSDYLSWFLTSKYGTDEEKGSLGFQLCDLSKRKKLSKDELTMVLSGMVHVLTRGLQFETFDPTAFVDELWTRLDQVRLS